MYSPIDLRRTSELFLLKRGWMNPMYELTDKVNTYGKMSYNGFSIRNATALAANDNWQFNNGPAFSRSIRITDQSGKVIGETKRKFLSNRITLNLQNGLRARFYRPSFWAREFIWASDELGPILRLKSYPLQYRDEIRIEQTAFSPALIPLLIFLGAHLSILDRRRKAVH